MKGMVEVNGQEEQVKGISFAEVFSMLIPALFLGSLFSHCPKGEWDFDLCILVFAYNSGWLKRGKGGRKR